MNLSKINCVEPEMCVKKFQRLLGWLTYVVERTRLDASYVENKLSRLTNVATREIYKYLACELQYLIWSKQLKLIYTCNE